MSPEACSCPESLALQRDLDAARARVLELTGEVLDAQHETLEHVRGYEGALVMVHELKQERNAARAEAASLRGALADTRDNVKSVSAVIRSIEQSGPWDDVAEAILAHLRERSRLPVTPGGDR